MKTMSKLSSPRWFWSDELAPPSPDGWFMDLAASGRGRRAEIVATPVPAQARRALTTTRRWP